MRLSPHNWRQTFARLGMRRVKSSQKPRRRDTQYSPRCETLEPRQLLAIDVTNFELKEDTGPSNTDLITSVPTVQGTLTGSSTQDTFVQFSTDNDTSDFEGEISVGVGNNFEYDLTLADASLASYTGTVYVHYRTVEKPRGRSGPNTYGSWQSFTFTKQPDPAPEIDVQRDDSSALIVGGTLNLGTTTVGTSVNHTLTVRNTGTDDLTLNSGSWSLPTGFSIVNNFGATTLAPSAQTTFTVKLDAVTAGFHTGTASFTNSDSDEGTYSFTISGDVESLQPEIEIRDDQAQVLASGSGTFDFGSTAQNSLALEKTFEIRNLGVADLTINVGSISVPTGYTLVTPPAATVSPQGTTTFVIRQDLTNTGTFNGTVSITNNDADEGTYTFSLNGQVTAAVLLVDEPEAVLNAVTVGGQDAISTTAAYGDHFADELIRVDPDRSYLYSARVRSGPTSYNAANVQYAGLIQYDIDGLEIQREHVYKHTGSADARLTQAINPGDTVIHLDTVTGWNNGAGDGRYRTLAWYGCMSPLQKDNSKLFDHWLKILDLT